MTVPSMADEPRAIRIAATGSMASVQVGGADLSAAVNGYTVEHHAGQPPMVVLYASPAADPMVFAGIAHVAVAGQPDGPGIAEFLADIDPAALHRAALDRDDLDGSSTELTTAMLRQLADWARGAT